jgi:hypothetical protein
VTWAAGNHRASVFRRHVGAALIRRDGRADELLRFWLDRPPSEPGEETSIEHEVIRHIGAMPQQESWADVLARCEPSAAGSR